MAISKRRGTKSSAQDNFLEPLNVTNLTAVDVGTNRPYLATAATTQAGASGTGGAVDLSWTLPSNSPAATSYDITTTPATYTANTSSTTYRFEGLVSGQSYTFTVIPKNSSGSAKTPNTTSSSVSATTVPQAPQSVTASASSANSNTVSWTIGANGGKPLSAHNVYGSDNNNSLGLSASATSATINDPGAAPGAQTYYVTAVNANGTSANSNSTGSVTTIPPFFPFFPPFFPPSFGTCNCVRSYCWQACPACCGGNCGC